MIYKIFQFYLQDFQLKYTLFKYGYAKIQNWNAKNANKIKNRNQIHSHPLYVHDLNFTLKTENLVFILRRKF